MMRARWLLLAGLAAIPACAKNDVLGAAQEEGLHIAKEAQPKVDDLSRRAELVGRSELPDDVRPVLGRVRSLLQETRAHLNGAPAKLTAAVQTGHLDEVLKVSSNMEHEVEHALVEATEGVESIENLVAVNDSSPTKLTKPGSAPASSSPAAPTAPATPTEPTEAPPAPPTE